MDEDEEAVRRSYRRDVQRWCLALCHELVPDDPQLLSLFQSTPPDLGGYDHSAATMEWMAAEDLAERDYLDRALQQLTAHGHPEDQFEGAHHSPARELITAYGQAVGKLGYVMADGTESDLLAAVLTWLCAQYENLEVAARLRNAALKVAVRAEFCGRFSWTGHSRHRPKPHKGPE